MDRLWLVNEGNVYDTSFNTSNGYDTSFNSSNGYD